MSSNAETFTKMVQRLEAGAVRGDADALCALATVEAAGAGRPQDFDRAFALLRQAAGAGSAEARRQLEMLGDAPFALPAKQSLSEQPRIRVMEGFASPEICRHVIERARGHLAPALIWDEEANQGRADPNRSNRAVELELERMDVVVAVLRARIAAATGLPEPVFETSQVMHYAPRQEFRPHYDFLDAAQPGQAADIARRGQRIATFLIYLNDDFEGGETDFPQAGLRYRGRTGDAFFFANVTGDSQPDPLTLHAGLPPTSGEKWIFSQWIRDRSPAPPA